MSESNLWDRIQSIFEPRKARTQRRVEACEEALAAGDWEAALERSRELAEEEDHPFAWETRARALWALDKPEKAIEVLRLGVSRHSKVEAMWALLGACLLSMDDQEDAERAFRHALILKPSATAWLQLATLLARQRRHLEALDAFHEAGQLARVEEGFATERPAVSPRQQADIGRLTCLVELGRTGEARSLGRNLLDEPLPAAMRTRILGWLARLTLDAEREQLLLAALREHPEPWTLGELRVLRDIVAANAARWWGTVRGGPEGEPYLRRVSVIARDADEALALVEELDGWPVAWEVVKAEEAGGERLGVEELGEPERWDLPPGTAGAPTPLAEAPESA